MLSESLQQFLNLPVVFSLLTLSLLLTAYLERARLRRWQAARASQSRFPAWGRLSDKVFFWLEFLATFLLVALFFFGSAIILRLLTTSTTALFGTPLLALAIGTLGLAALIGIIMLESEE